MRQKKIQKHWQFEKAYSLSSGNYPSVIMEVGFLSYMNVNLIGSVAILHSLIRGSFNKWAL